MRIQLTGVSGREWVVDLRAPVAPGTARSTPFAGWEAGVPGHRVWVQRANEGQESIAHRDHLRRAYKIGQLLEVAACTYIHAPIDLIEGCDVYVVSDLAETDLGCVLRRGPLESGDIVNLEHRLRAALAVLHGPGLVHGDMREDNVLRVDGEWKLADLGGVVRQGDLIVELQSEEACGRGGPSLFEPAHPQKDIHALRAILVHAAPAFEG